MWLSQTSRSTTILRFIQVLSRSQFGCLSCHVLCEDFSINIDEGVLTINSLFNISHQQTENGNQKCMCIWRPPTPQSNSYLKNQRAIRRANHLAGPLQSRLRTNGSRAFFTSNLSWHCPTLLTLHAFHWKLISENVDTTGLAVSTIPGPSGKAK